MPQIGLSAPGDAGAPAQRVEAFAAITRSRGYGAVWVSARGELGLANAPRFGRTLMRALDRALLLVIDLRDLAFIDCAGIHAILDADIQARQTGHRVVIIHAGDTVGRLLTILELTDQLKLVDLSQIDLT